MLKFFLNKREPKFEEIHVIIRDDNYIVLDRDNDIFKNLSLDGIGQALYSERISEADLLIS